MLKSWPCVCLYRHKTITKICRKHSLISEWLDHRLGGTFERYRQIVVFGSNTTPSLMWNVATQKWSQTRWRIWPTTTATTGEVCLAVFRKRLAECALDWVTPRFHHRRHLILRTPRHPPSRRQLPPNPPRPLPLHRWLYSTPRTVKVKRSRFKVTDEERSAASLSDWKTTLDREAAKLWTGQRGEGLKVTTKQALLVLQDTHASMRRWID